MKVLVLYDYPPSPGGLATQGDLLYRGLLELGVEARAAHLKSDLEKEWYYRWFKPDVVVGVGFWGDFPDIVHHPQRFGMLPVPWLLADGYVANYRHDLNEMPLILVTADWVRETYVRDGIRGDHMVTLPVGCDTDAFIPREPGDPKVHAVRQILGVRPDQLMILTVGGDAASKGAREVMEALARLSGEVPDWRYVCKVWPQPRTAIQNALDEALAAQLGMADRVSFPTHRVSRNLMPFLISACDVYAAPSRLEGFGMPQVEAGACGKPVIGIRAMAMLDTLVHGETAFLASVAQENRLAETVLGPESGFEPGHRIIFDRPRVADYRADVGDLASHLRTLLNDAPLRRRMGEAGRRRVVERFDYRRVARRFVEILSEKLWGA
ncbi:glycosyltransferase family 4 protein [Geothrix sp. 21YS21S-4]|uniref:glycosyltransferase family 4 protein n=1 Tax=Geothrix sp. 21YS21S-4 TaxID=3068889 RepID=UPI0027B890FB|nr:glycosyltransferase family 4 protein [Geothrix sp. 21YS21S-4]